MRARPDDRRDAVTDPRGSPDLATTVGSKPHRAGLPYGRGAKTGCDLQSGPKIETSNSKILLVLQQCRVKIQISQHGKWETAQKAPKLLGEALHSMALTLKK